MTKNQQRDIACNWHLYTQHKISEEPFVITKGKDALHWDEHGNEFIDANGSLWCSPQDNNNSKIVGWVFGQYNLLRAIMF